MKKHYQSPKSNMMLQLNMISLLVLAVQSIFLNKTFFGKLFILISSFKNLKKIRFLGIRQAPSRSH